MSTEPISAEEQAFIKEFKSLANVLGDDREQSLNPETIQYCAELCEARSMIWAKWAHRAAEPFDAEDFALKAREARNCAKLLRTLLPV